MNRKQVIVMRTDLNMRKGKMIAQGAHASLKAIIDQGSISYDREEGLGGPGRQSLDIPITEDLDGWLNGNFKKICVQVDSEEKLLAIYDKAVDLGLPHALITDNGLTEFNGVPTMTCIAVGPARDDLIDQVTGGLKLL